MGGCIQDMTMIRVSKDNAKRIKKYRIANLETYNEIIGRLMDMADELKELKANIDYNR